MMSRYAVINNANVVTNITNWDGVTPWEPMPYQPVDADGNPVGDPTPQTAVPDTDPPTAQIGYTYNPADGTFTPVPEPVTTQPGLISRILSALNPFK
jgi:hypothetical protein